MVEISKPRSYVKSRVTYYTKLTLMGILVMFTGILGFILSIGVLELTQLSLFALLFLAGMVIVKYGWSKRVRWSRGARGEKIVAKKLEKLPKKYTTISDVEIPNMGGDIDHVVVGPTGIYVVETKNYKPAYIPDEDCWYHTSGKESLQNPAQQVKLQAAKLKEFLERKMGKKVKKNTFKPVVSPINHNLILKKDIKSYDIVYPEDLVRYLTRGRKILSSKEVKKIVNILARYGRME